MTQHILEKDTEEYIRRHGLVKAGDVLVVGVSGGADSMALLQVLARLAPDLNLGLVVATVDHGLRPAETVREIALVEQTARELGLDFFVKALPVRTYAEKHGLSLEEAARDLRYDFLAETARQVGARCIGVAHTADDQAEGVLLRLIRGTGRAGLGGMKPLSDLQVIRPFLEIPKQRLLEYLAQRGIPYLEDSSNSDPVYLRNRVRHILLPLLVEKFNPAIRATLNRTATIFRDEDTVLDTLAEQGFLQVVDWQEADPPQAGIKIGELLLLPLALQRRVVEKVLLRMGSAPSFARVEELIALAGSGRNSGDLHLHHGLRVGRREGLIYFYFPQGRVVGKGRLPEARPGEDCEVVLPGVGVYLLPQSGRQVRVSFSDQLPSPKELREGLTEFLDAELITFPLEVRSPRPGDQFYPLGGKGHKKVAAFLADLKIPVRERGREMILTSNGRILAILGRRIDHNFRLTSATRRVMAVLMDDPVESNTSGESG
ncbi:MAG: tRNA lysidine(34) synthetase TilS [Proteobacteria bacterium]|nr:tRNA lysidine(34) synthetase TilS [Pseudomonadota bacterium]MBU1686067.1 tRNA lysidine(34) synthetase TilS [Pseudomonadota bacterium]